MYAASCRWHLKTQNEQGVSHMARNQRRTRKRARQPFLEKGIGALALGVSFLLVSMFLSSHPVLSAAGNAVRTPAWIAIGIGLVLLGIHHALKKKTGVDTEQPLPRISPPPQRTAAPPPPLAKHEHATRQAAQVPKVTAAASTAWSSEVFKAIEWRRFEAVCEALFAQAGFETRTQSHGPDGGVDVWLHSKNAQGSVSVVQCKHWQSKPVGVKEVREFFGVMSSHQLKRGTYATTSTFTPDALAFAKSNGIHLLDGAGLLTLIAQRTPEQQQALLAVAYEGDYARPTCASCGIKMVDRTPSKGGSAFWGCVNFPRCRSRMGMVAR
jgi:restriction system protein